MCEPNTWKRKQRLPILPVRHGSFLCFQVRAIYLNLGSAIFRSSSAGFSSDFLLITGIEWRVTSCQSRSCCKSAHQVCVRVCPTPLCSDHGLLTIVHFPRRKVIDALVSQVGWLDSKSSRPGSGQQIGQVVNNLGDQAVLSIQGYSLRRIFGFACSCESLDFLSSELEILDEHRTTHVDLFPTAITVFVMQCCHRRGWQTQVRSSTSRLTTF